MLPLLHPDIVVTWQNGEVNRGHAGVRAFFEKMGRQAFGGYKVPPEPDELTILHGGTTGISFGRSVAQFNVLGSSFEFHNRWTATLVKQDGKWLWRATTCRGTRSTTRCSTPRRDRCTSPPACRWPVAS